MAATDYVTTINRMCKAYKQIHFEFVKVVSGWYTTDLIDPWLLALSLVYKGLHLLWNLSRFYIICYNTEVNDRYWTAIQWNTHLFNPHYPLKLMKGPKWSTVRGIHIHLETWQAASQVICRNEKLEDIFAVHACWEIGQCFQYLLHLKFLLN